MKKTILISLIAIAAIVSLSGCLSFECGDGSCNRLFEDAVSCQIDCAPKPTENCGNAAIDAGENCANCPGDVRCGRGQICCNESCTIAACSTDSHCNDNNPATTDKCLNAGSCVASCSNTLCAIACNSNAGCNDNNPATTDTCSNPGTCSAVCLHKTAQICGDGTCSAGEDDYTCPQDCGYY